MYLVAIFHNVQLIIHSLFYLQVHDVIHYTVFLYGRPRDMELARKPAPAHSAGGACTTGSKSSKQTSNSSSIRTQCEEKQTKDAAKEL
jgi:hypothetical protein